VCVCRAVLVTDRTENAIVGVVFPGLPGCVSAGDTAQDAARMAQEALALHLEGMLIDGERLPSPLPLEAALPDWLVAGHNVIEAGRLMVKVRIDIAAVPA